MKKSLAAILTIIIVLIALRCVYNIVNRAPSTTRNYRQSMRDLIQGISAYAKGIKPSFIVIPQNGEELLTRNGKPNGPPSHKYIRAIDGVGREELFYGYSNDNEPTPKSIRNSMLPLLDMAESNGVEVLVIDYCWTPSFVDDSYKRNSARGYISFAADHRELDDIPAYPPEPYNANSLNVTSLKEARNFLYLINPGLFPDKDSYLNALRETNYDVLIIDLFYNGEELTPEDVASLKTKANGGSRLVIAYMCIGEAEDYRYYWREEWETNPPPWLLEENPDWPGSYRVCYWDAAWREIIYSYLDKILDAGFDGVYLDGVDAFEYFENL